MEQLATGVKLNDGMTLPAKARKVAQPVLWDRDPPIRVRKTVSDSWLELSIREGRNRQIRRMTANVGFPTLRLVRIAVGEWTIEGLQPGQYREMSVPMTIRRMKPNPPQRKP